MRMHSQTSRIHVRRRTLVLCGIVLAILLAGVAVWLTAGNAHTSAAAKPHAPVVVRQTLSASNARRLEHELSSPTITVQAKAFVPQLRAGYIKPGQPKLPVGTSVTIKASTFKANGSTATVKAETSTHLKFSINLYRESGTWLINEYLAPSLISEATFEPYVGTWYSPESGVTMIMNSTGEATFTWAGNTIEADFQSSTTGLNGKVTDAQATDSGFAVGSPISLTMASGGVVFNPYTAADPTELYKQASPSQGSLSSYAGTWYAHSTELVIAASGMGHLAYRDYNTCPHATPSNGLPVQCNIVEQLHVTITASGATATVASSYAEISVLSTGNKVIWKGSSGIPAGTTYPLTLQGGGLLSVNMTGTPFANGLLETCLAGSTAYNNSECGA